MKTQHKTPARIAGAAIAASVVFSLAACSTGGSSGVGGDNVLSIGWSSLERPGIEAALKVFKKDHPDVQVKLSSADTDAYQATLRTQLSSGTAPDVMYVWPGNGNPGAIDVLAPAGYLADLSSEPWASSIPKSIAPYTQVDGKTYIAPMSFSGVGMIFNKETLDATGLTIPKTYAEVLGFCRDAKAKGKIAFDLGAQDIFAIMVPYALVATTVYSTEPDFDKLQAEGKTTFSKSAGYHEALDKEIEMQKAGCFGSAPTGTSFADSISHLADGSAIGTINITSILGQVYDAAPKTTFVMQPLPATDDANQTLMSGGSGAGPGINAKAKNPKLAKEFVDFLGTPEGQAAYSSGGGQLPAITDDSYKPPAILDTVYEYYQQNKVGPLLDQNWPNADVQQQLKSFVQQQLNGTATTADTLAAMDAAYARK